MVDTTVVITMACMLLWHRPAMARRSFFMGPEEAAAEPNTTTRAICMAKASRLQKPVPLPQAVKMEGPKLLVVLETTSALAMV